MKLMVTHLEATYFSNEAWALPKFSGSMLRGALGRALHRVSERGYQRLFEARSAERDIAPLIKAGERLPSALVPVFPPARPLRFKARQPFRLGVRVIGRDPDRDATLMDEVLGALEDQPIGPREVRLRLRSVARVGRGPEVLELVPGEDVHGRVRVETRTPMRLERYKKMVVSPDFAQLFGFMHRRLVRLASVHGEWEPADDERFRMLRGLAEHVETREIAFRMVNWRRHNLERDEVHEMKGVLGHAVYEGDYGVLRPYLYAASRLGVGKAVMFGLGQLDVRW